MTITTVSTAAALTAALKAARPGDTVLLQSGVYDAVTLRGVDLGGVTIASKNPDSPAVLTTVSLRESSGFTFRDLEFRAPSDGRAIDLYEVKDVHFTRLDVHGSLNGDPQDDGMGILVRFSQNVSIEDSEFHELGIGISHEDDQHLTIRGNDFHDLRLDGVRGGGTSWLTISENSFRDFYPEAADHPDAIQFWTRLVNVVAHDIVISDNKLLRGDGQDFQGIFINDESGIGYERISITGNLVVGSSYHGIYVESAKDVTITDNIVQGYTDKKSWIRIEDVDVATVSNNDATNVIVTAEATRVTSTDNTIITAATDGGAWALAAWEAAHGTGGGGSGGALNLLGDAGANTLTGGGLDDTLTGGGGLDLLTGGAGDDVFILESKSTIVELAGGGADEVRSSVTFTLPGFVEHLRLSGTKAVNGYGNALDNEVAGNGASNLLRGGGGADTLTGRAGADTLDGNAGADRLTGGAGIDRFVFGRADGADVVTDFGANGEHDILDLSALYSAGRTAVIVDTATGVVLDFGAGQTITLLGVDPGQLTATSSGYVF